MTYIPLARKWRPKCFADLIGQSHIVLPLQNALSQNKLHHAYLFTGTRGIGKTTVARIFAKALNCQAGIGTEPCLQCENCLAIDEGRSFDLIEVDGASRTRVEDTRELIETIQYAPTSGRFKIFIIDEVHMLSTHSFNALLKTLEEPPHHVKFLLATTDPQKIPATILSRCIQFNLQPISECRITQQLSCVLNAERFIYDQEALHLIAQNASGSMRDALTLCEQLMAVFPAGFKSQELREFIGASLEDYSFQLLDALCTQKVISLIDICQKLAEQQTVFPKLIQFLLMHLHDCIIQQILSEKDCPSIIKSCSEALSDHIIHTLYLMAEKGLQDLDWAPNHAVGFKMLMLRMAQYIKMNCPERAFQPITLEKAPEQSRLVIDEPAQVKNTPAIIESEAFTSPEDWNRIVTSLKIDGLGKSALNHSTYVKINDGFIILEIHKKNESLFTPMIKQRIENALSEHFQQPIKIKLQYLTSEKIAQTPAQIQENNLAIEKAQLEKDIHENPLIQRILTEGNAEIIENSMTKFSNEL